MSEQEVLVEEVKLEVEEDEKEQFGSTDNSPLLQFAGEKPRSKAVIGTGRARKHKYTLVKKLVPMPHCVLCTILIMVVTSVGSLRKRVKLKRLKRRPQNQSQSAFSNWSVCIIMYPAIACVSRGTRMGFILLHREAQPGTRQSRFIVLFRHFLSLLLFQVANCYACMYHA